MMAAESAMRGVSLAWLLEGLCADLPPADVEVCGLATDSRSVRPGDLFLATQGLQVHGLAYAGQAVRQGAAAIAWEPVPGSKVADEATGLDVPALAVNGLAHRLGLVAARLRMNYDTIDEMELSGTEVRATFVTPYREMSGYNPGDPHEFQLTVYDGAGNTWTDVAVITPGTGFNYAPRPFVRTYPRSWAVVGETVELDASGTSDVNDAVGSLVVEWDLDGDGVFDTPPTTNKYFYTTFDSVGVPVIRLRVTDPHGAVSVSTPVNLRVVPACPGDLDGDGEIGLSDLAQLLAGYGTTSGATYEMGDLDGDGDVDLSDLAALLSVYGTDCE